ncbi:MAG: methyltransferase domain-containing protein [Anaerolineales bacterium]|nr:methyltransferase domain-containing protein [Anaerolineales bacterium]MCB8954807.1 methyltransferase domain-containing protein [Ardenticatenales bacterium]
MFADLPPLDLLARQSDWLAPARARLLRRLGVAHRRRVLDLGAGYGVVTAELARRSDGLVVALDRREMALRAAAPIAGAARVAGDGGRLPFAAGAFDLVFSQLVWLWLPLAEALPEVWRVLAPGGALVALEPDYGGLIEHPPAVAVGEVWRAALARAGGDALVGRKMPALLAAQGFIVQVDLFPTLSPPAAARFDLLRGLPLTSLERQVVDKADTASVHLRGVWEQVVHLPFFLITAVRP